MRRVVAAALAAVVMAAPLGAFLGTPAPAQQVSSLNPGAASDLGPDYTVDTLPPCTASIARRTAWVTDLMGQPNGDRALCDGADWKPLRPLAVQVLSTGNMTVGALRNAPTIVVTGVIATGATNTVTLSTSDAYRGANLCVVRKATGLGSLVMGVTSLALSLNGWVCYQFNGSTWEQTQGGTLL